MSPRWQYPAKTQPVEPISLPVLDWLVQQPDPVRRPERPVPGEATLVEFGVPAAALADIDWLVQHPDPVRLPNPLPEQLSFTRLVELSEIPIDWLVQHPDPLPRPTTAIALAASGAVEARVALFPIPVVSFASPTSMIIDEGLYQYQGRAEPVPAEPFVPVASIDWLVQHPDPVLPQPRPPTAPILVEFGVPVPPVIPDIDFIVQHPDPLPPPLPVNTEPELAFEHEDIIPAPDWLVQHPDPVLPEPPRLGEYVLGELVEIPIDSWLRPPSEPVLPLPPRQDWYARVDLELIPEEVLLDKWWQPMSQPLYPPVRLEGFTALLEFAAPVIPFIFVFRDCLALWQMEDRRLWPSGASPSGYFNVVEAIVPSGFIKPSEEPEESTPLWKI